MSRQPVPITWDKLGINYNSTSGVTDSIDLPYIFSKGIRKIRMLIVQHDDASIKTTWRAKALLAKSYGFTHVIYGLTDNDTINAADWATYHDNVVAEATYCQANFVCDEFNIGNELELRTSDMSGATLRSNLRTLATDVKAVYSGIVSYGVSRSAEGSVGWQTDATLGVLDFLDLHDYSNSWSDTYVFGWFLSDLMASFPGKIYVGEWNLYSDSNSIPVDQDVRVAGIQARLSVCQSANVDSYFYNYTNSSGTLGVKNLNGTYQKYWNSLVKGRTPVSRSAVARTAVSRSTV